LLRALDRLFAPPALREPRAPFRRRLVAEVRARLTRPLGVRRGFVSPRMGSTSGSLSISGMFGIVDLRTYVVMNLQAACPARGRAFFVHRVCAQSWH